LYNWPLPSSSTSSKCEKLQNVLDHQKISFVRLDKLLLRSNVVLMMISYKIALFEKGKERSKNFIAIA
jgi:hypothetical protein